MTLINFTIQHDQLAASPDTSDEGSDADLIPLIGDVIFTPQFSDHKPILATGYEPRPTAFTIREFVGHIGMDGRLRNGRNGALGIRLIANDPVLGLDTLRYCVRFHLTTPLGEPVPVDGGCFDAPSEDVSLWLVDLLAGTPAPILNVLDGGFSNSDFTDLADCGEPSTTSLDLYDGGNV